MIYRTACYSIKQRDTTLVVLLLPKEAKNTMQWSHLNLFFIVWCQFFCFIFARQILMFLLSKLHDLKKIFTFHGNIYTNWKLKPFSNFLFLFRLFHWIFIQFLGEKDEEKSNFLSDYKRSYSLNFSLVLSVNNVLIALVNGKIK